MSVVFRIFHYFNFLKSYSIVLLKLWLGRQNNWQIKRKKLVYWLGLSLCISLILNSCTQNIALNFSETRDKAIPIKTIRIGYQPHGSFLYLYAYGNLDKRLAEQGITVDWISFPAGLPILKAIGEGKVDMGYGGVVPPVFAQAQDIPFNYIASDTAVPDTIGLLVPNNSSIKQLADLKGKKIAVTKLSAGHYFLIQVLIKSNLQLEDIQLVDLPPVQAKQAFVQGKVDAWIGWNPFLAELQEEMPVKTLTNAKGLMNDRNFYFASRKFANEHPELVKIVVEETRKAGVWVEANPKEAAKALVTNAKIRESVALKMTKIRRYEALPIQEREIEEQQRIAELFLRLGLLPKRIWVEDAVWKQELGK